ncbi:SRPBCC family protein [Bacteroidales bacterium M08MB]|nr:SRPBCC family protein [Perlabentimonas gracilis]
MALYILKTTQGFQTTSDKLWDFISSPKNLKDITPDYMGFDIISDNQEQSIYPGMIIEYQVRPIMGIKTNWVTEITQVKEGKYFIDEQRFGPYKFWHHTHKIIPIEEGVVMEDTVLYLPPMGIIGRVANSLFIKKRLDQIFEFRRAKLQKKFGNIPSAS